MLASSDEKAVYHVKSRTALDGFPLAGVEKDFMLGLIKRFADLYFTEILGFFLMGNLFHLLVKMVPDRRFTDSDIKARLETFYSKEDRNYTDDLIP
jgi:putative transposase